MKLKTNKLTKNRIKTTGQGKLMHRPIHQNHFNAKDEGSKKRNKRKAKTIIIRKIERLLPYGNK